MEFAVDRESLKQKMYDAGFYVSGSADSSIDYLLKRLKDQNPLIGLQVVLEKQSTPGYLCLTEDFIIFAKDGIFGTDFIPLWKGENTKNLPSWNPRLIDFNIFSVTGYKESLLANFNQYTTNFELHGFDPKTMEIRSLRLGSKLHDYYSFLEFTRSGRTPTEIAAKASQERQDALMHVPKL